MAGKRKPNGYWNDPKNMDAYFDERIETLRGIPKASEAMLMIEALGQGKYHPKVRTYNDYLKHWGLKVHCDIGKWMDLRNIDKYFDDFFEKHGRIPKSDEMPGGALKAIASERCPGVKTYNGYLKHRGFEASNEKRWGDKEARINALKKMVEESGKKVCDIIALDFRRHGLGTLLRGYYHNSPYKALKEAGLIGGIEPFEMKGGVPDGYWDDSHNINRYFDWQVETLRRIPRSREMASVFGAFIEGKYPGVKTYNDYLRHWGFQVNHDMEKWKSKDSRVAAIRQMAEKSGKDAKELRKEDFKKDGLAGLLNTYYHSSPYGALKEAGLADFEPWERIGGKVPKRYWDDAKNIDLCFDQLVEKWRRVPKAKEMPGAALDALREGKYHPDVRTYNNYLKHWGFKISHESEIWNDPKNIDAAFDNLVETLRRIPLAREMPGGALTVMREGNYHGARTFNDYLKHWGFKPQHEMKDMEGLMQRLIE